MDLRIFDLSLTPLGVVDECKSVIWSIRYFDTGELKILAPVTENNKKLLAVGNIVTLHNGYIEREDIDGRWRRGAQITYVKYERDIRGMEQIEASGYALSRFFNARLLYPSVSSDGSSIDLQTPDGTSIMRYGEDAAGLCKFFSYAAFIDPEDDMQKGKTYNLLGRKVPNMVMIETPTTYGKNLIKEWNVEGTKTLGDWMHDACTNAKIGYDILVNERLKLFGVYIYEGDDLTGENTDGNIPCVFSRENDTIINADYSDSINAMKTAEYVHNVDGSAWADAGGSGLERYETFLTTENLKMAGGMSAADILRILEAKGTSDLTSFRRTHTFHSNINPNASLVYKKDFNVGDRVTCIDTEWGLKINARITEIEFSYEKGKSDMTVTFGESAPTLLQTIKKMR